MAKAKSKKVTIEDVIIPIEEQPYEIPENWCWTSLSSVAEWGSGGTPSRKNPDYYEGNIPWIKTGELDDGYIFDSEEKITEDAVAHSSAKLFPTGSVLVAMYGATIGKTAILGIPATTNQACACARCNDSLDNKYLFYYLRSQKYSFIAKGKGGAQPNISQDIIKSYPIPLPPLAEQKRIVEQIDNLFAKLDEAREKSISVLESFDTNRSAILYAAFSGELSKTWREKNKVAKETWKEMTVGDIGDVVTGSTPSTKNSEYYGGDIPFIKPTELNQGKNVCTAADYLTELGRDVSRPVRKGSTCVCCIGATISKCGMLQVDAVTNQQINTIVPHDFMLDEYVYYYCSSDLFKNILIENASATTLPIINKSRMSQLPVRVPDIEEQKYIVEKLNDLLQKQDEAKRLAGGVVEKIDLIKKSILAKAFRGELGTNNLEEESAIELLKGVLEA